MALKDLMTRGTQSFEKSPEAPRPEPQPVAAPPPVAAPQSPAPTSYLGPTISLVGKLRCSESLRIDGRVEGEIHCDHLVAVGETGRVRANIEGDIVVIGGEVEGDITARRKITLEKTARVTGDLCTPGIVIQEGAQLEGRIMIGGEQGEPQKPAAAKSPYERTAEKPAAPRPPEGARPSVAPGATAPPPRV